MAEFDVDAMIQRFADRAEAVKKRSFPPVEGEDRKMFIRQAKADHLDYALIGNASWELADGNLVLSIPLAPESS